MYCSFNDLYTSSQHLKIADCPQVRTPLLERWTDFHVSSSLDVIDRHWVHHFEPVYDATVRTCETGETRETTTWNEQVRPTPVVHPSFFLIDYGKGGSATILNLIGLSGLTSPNGRGVDRT